MKSEVGRRKGICAVCDREKALLARPPPKTRENGASPSSPSSTAFYLLYYYSTPTTQDGIKRESPLSLALSHPLRASVSSVLPRPLARPLKAPTNQKAPSIPSLRPRKLIKTHALLCLLISNSNLIEVRPCFSTYLTSAQARPKSSYRWQETSSVPRPTTS